MRIILYMGAVWGFAWVLVMLALMLLVDGFFIGIS
jgi:hypothetical protein